MILVYQIWVPVRNRPSSHQNLVDMQNGEPTNNALNKDNIQDDVIDILKILFLIQNFLWFEKKNTLINSI